MYGSGVFVTAVPTLLQSIGQSNVPANTAAIIYATTPLWSAVLEFLFLGEAMSSKVTCSISSTT
jgi:drug/metabolite transporter (DMT)-like permease